MGSNHSVTVRGNEWYDHSAETGGGPVSFLKEFYGMDYPEAVLALLGQNGGPLTQIRAPNEKVKKPFELPQPNGDNRRMFAYLAKHRHLDRDVVAMFARQRLLYEDQKYHNVVFVGKGTDGIAHHAHKRSTNNQGKSFRMTVEGSDFRYAFNWPGSILPLCFAPSQSIYQFRNQYSRPVDYHKHCNCFNSIVRFAQN